MGTLETERFDVQKFAESLVESVNEGVKWERRKLQWILEEQKKAEAGKAAA